MQLELGISTTSPARAARTSPVAAESPAPPRSPAAFRARTPQLEARPGATAMVSPAPNELADLVEAFLRSAVDSPSTRRAYRAHLLRAIGTLRVRTLAEITPPRLAALRAAVVMAPLAPATQSQALSAVRSFLAWTSSVAPRSAISTEVVRRLLRLPEVHTVTAPQILADEESARILSAARPGCGERAMLMVLLGAGLRECELCALDCRDIIATSGQPARLHVRGKRRRERLVPLRPEVAAGVGDYLAATGRTAASPGALFLPHDAGAGSRRSPRLSTRSVRRRVAKLLRSAGVSKNVGAHGLRHTFATAVVRNGGKIHVLSRLLGHASIVTTQRYIDHMGLDELLDPLPHLPSE